MRTRFKSNVRKSTWAFLIAVYFAAIVGGIVGVASTPNPGATFAIDDGEVIITGFESGSAIWSEGGRVGDIVETINGRPALVVYSMGDEIRDVAVRPPDSAPGQNLTEINIISSPMSMIDELVVLNILGLAFALIGTLIYLRATRTTNTMLFAYMAMGAAISMAIGPASLANHMWARLLMGAAVYVATLMLLAFFFWFTRSMASNAAESRTRASGWVPEIVLAFSFAIAAPWTLTLLPGIDLFPILRPGMFLLLVLATVGSTGLLIYRLRTADREHQEQLRIVTLGTSIGLIPMLWLTAIPQIVTGSQIFSGELTVIGFILIPITFGYAIAKHDLMGIRRLFHRGAAYAIISAGIIVVYGTILTGLDLLAPNTEDLGPIQTALLVLMFAAAPTLTSVRRNALRLVDRVIFDGAVTQDDLVSAISTVSANENDPDRALSRAISFTGQGFDVEYAALLRFRPDGPVIDYTYNNPSSDVRKRLLDVTHEDARGVKRSVLPGTDDAILVGTLREIDREPRAIVLGPKVNEDIFTEEEVDLLKTVTAVVSTALTRIHLINDVQQQSEQLINMGNDLQNIQEIERQEISAYLHDEPLQKLAYVNSRIRELDISDDLKSMLEDVVRDLRGTSASLSPEMLRSHGLMSALKWMVQDQQQRGPFRVFLEISGIQDDERVSDDLELTIYRAAQEALNNCRKHADAKSVWVKVSRTRTDLHLAVEDNGVGIKTQEFETTERRPDQGLGLRGLKQRITNLGGVLEIKPRPSRGTAFTVRLPLHHEEVELAS